MVFDSELGNLVADSALRSLMISKAKTAISYYQTVYPYSTTTGSIFRIMLPISYVYHQKCDEVSIFEAQ